MNGTLQERMLPAPVGGGFEMDGYWIWCGSVIKGEDGKYHMFASRWSKEYPMHPGWLAASEIVRAVSDVPEGPYRFQEVVLPARGAQYWDGRATHNPHIKKIGDTYVLYYVGMTHPFPDPEDKANLNLHDPITISARSNKRIGIATSKSIFGPWRRYDRPVFDTRPNGFDNFFVSNPAPCVREDGSVLMVYKSRSYFEKPYNRDLHGPMEFGVCMAGSFDGTYKRLTDTPIFDCRTEEVEDPFIWEDEDGYNMMAKDMRGGICTERQAGVYANSKDGIHWTFEKNKPFYSRKILWDDGVIREMGNLERPFLLFENGVATHAFFATGEGENEAGFSKLKRSWNMVIPLKHS